MACDMRMNGAFALCILGLASWCNGPILSQAGLTNGSGTSLLSGDPRIGRLASSIRRGYTPVWTTGPWSGTPPTAIICFRNDGRGNTPAACDGVDDVRLISHLIDLWGTVRI